MSPEKSKRQERREKMRSQAQRSRLMMIGGIIIVALVLVLLIASTQNNAAQNIIAITPADLPIHTITYPWNKLSPLIGFRIGARFLSTIL